MCRPDACLCRPRRWTVEESPPRDVLGNLPSRRSPPIRALKRRRRRVGLLRVLHLHRRRRVNLLRLERSASRRRGAFLQRALRAGDGAADGPAEPPLEKSLDAEDRTDDDDDGRAARSRAAASSRAIAPAVSAKRLATSRSAFASFAFARFSAPLRRRSSASARAVEAMNAALPNADVVPGASAAAAAASAEASARPYPGGRLPLGRSDFPSDRARVFTGG